MPNTAKKVPVMELFGPTIQGEGALTGQVSYFIRTGGCPYRCVWCDQMEAVDPKLIKKGATYMSQEEIIEKAMGLINEAAGLTSKIWMTLSGGDPLMWDLEKVAGALATEGISVAVETQGTFAPAWLNYVDLITCSPKPPSSKMSNRVNYDVINQYYRMYGANRMVLKVVIFDDKDLEFAAELKKRYSQVPFYLSVGTPTAEECPDDDKMKRAILKRYRWLADEFLKKPELWGATIGPQMHTFLYAREKGR